MPKIKIIKKQIKEGENYFLLIFEGHSSRICFGKLMHLSKKEHSYVFRGDRIFKVFNETEIKSTKTGQPLRAEIKNGRLMFMVMFLSKEEAERSIEIFPKNIVIRLIKKSIAND